MTAPTARYVLTQDLMVQALTYATEADARRVRWRYVLYGAGALVFAAVLFVDRSADGGFYGFVGVAFLVVGAIHPVLYRRRLGALTARRVDVGRPVTVRVTDAEFQVDVEGVSREAQVLSTLHRVEARDGGVLVETFPREAIWIPPGAFADAADRAAFERALLAGARLPDPAL